jgi:hypothetical protein
MRGAAFAKVAVDSKAAAIKLRLKWSMDRPPAAFRHHGRALPRREDRLHGHSLVSAVPRRVGGTLNQELEPGWQGHDATACSIARSKNRTGGGNPTIFAPPSRYL